MKRDRKAKIVATLGPASSTAEKIEELFRAGVDVFRLNFSHGNMDDHIKRYKIIREIESKVNHPVSVLQDLQGPKIRIGVLKTGEIDLVVGDTVQFVLNEEGTDKDSIPLPHESIFEGIVPGDRLFLDDGRRRVEVIRVVADMIEARVVHGGKLTDRKGVNLPDTFLPLSPLTKKDHADLALGLELGVDWVALSFIQKPADLLEARGIIGDRAAVLAKIEKPKALEKIDGIIDLCDAIMIARGDLGVETPPEEVPGRQKELIRACRMAGKPVIVATQMLESMMHAAMPTRAEASDIATAIYDGTDAVMLSGESAAGDFPLESVSVMSRVIERTESHKHYRSIIKALEPVVEPPVHHTVSAAAAEIAEKTNAAAIIAFTSSGATASRIARMRPEVPILALTPNKDAVHRLVLTWGAYAIHTTAIESYGDMAKQARHYAVTQGFAHKGDRIVVVAGVPFGVAGSTNNVRVLDI
ncbi:MAG TPA: Pyruvate kinase [Hyphomicrobiaceae bacterium MAG_BT-2024]